MSSGSAAGPPPQAGCLDRTTLEWVRGALTGGGVTDPDQAGDVIDWLAGVLAALPSDDPNDNNGAPSHQAHRLMLAERVCLAAAAGRRDEVRLALAGWRAAYDRAAGRTTTGENDG